MVSGSVKSGIKQGKKITVNFRKDGELKTYLKKFNDYKHYTNFCKKMQMYGYKEIGSEVYAGYGPPMSHKNLKYRTTLSKTKVISHKDILECRRTMIEYTNDQKQALLHITSFLKSNDNFYLLVGNAGTGKTTIAENIASYSNASMLAPTNAAIKRLKDKFMSKDVIEKRFKTIHQELYGSPDPATGEFIPKESLRSSKVYIVDESSMIEARVLNDLVKEAIKNNAKLIFLGDDFQLEPVGKDPKIFNWEVSNMRFKESWKFKLNEVKRNDGKILAVATHLRNNDKCSVLNYQTDEFKIVPRFTNNLPLDISHDSDFVVLVSTNKRRMTYNQQIRRAKFEEDSAEVIVDGERLISVANQMFLNGSMYTVKRPKIIKSFKASINTGSERYKSYSTYNFYLIEHEVEGSNESYKTVLIPDLDKPSLHPSSLMNIQEFKDDITIIAYDIKAGITKFNTEVNIATYGYATSVHKSQGNEWDHVYIDCDWLSEKWNHARWLYTAITRAKKRVELKASRYIQVKEI